MLAPVISVPLEYGVAAVLPPVSHCRELRFGRSTGLPEVKHDGLAGLRPEMGQWRQGTIKVADVQPKSHDIIMLLDQCADVFVTHREQYLVDDGVGAYIHEPPHF